MSILLNHHYDDDKNDSHRAFHHQKIMTISYPDHHSSLPYGLITPPSEMRSTNMDTDPNNILAPTTTSRYFLRKQLSSTYPVNDNNYQNNNYNSYLQARRRSGSSTSTTATSSATSNTIARPVSPVSDIESRDFNVGEFTATVIIAVPFFFY